MRKTPPFLMNLKSCLVLASVLGFALAPQAHATRKWNSKYAINKKRFVTYEAPHSPRLGTAKLKNGPSYKIPPPKPAKGPVSRRRHG